MKKSKDVKKLTEPKTIHNGIFIRLMSDNGWEYVERRNCTGVVVIVAITNNNEVLFTEQYRPPVKQNVIEFPAGLVNDLDDVDVETDETAAIRELLEETGYRAHSMTRLVAGPSSAGLTSETQTFFLAKNLEKIREGGGDHTESIRVHVVLLNQVIEWLKRKETEGFLVDPKVYAGLYFINRSTS